jgi:DNA-binding NarL/FixJ family response regulator
MERKTRNVVVRLAVIDDEPIAREGIIHALTSKYAIQVVESREVHPGMADKLRDEDVDLIVIDANPIDTQEAAYLKALREACPECPIIIFTHEESEEALFQAIALGASGYVLKTAKMEDLWAAVEGALAGNVFAGVKITPHMMAGFVSYVRGKRGRRQADLLTSREREVLTLMVQGRTTGEIATELFLSLHTVRTYRQRMMQKLGTRNGTELLLYAFSQGLAPMPKVPGSASREHNASSSGRRPRHHLVDSWNGLPRLRWQSF